jgi:hypothetical protein
MRAFPVDVRSSSRSKPALERPLRCPTRSRHRGLLRSQLCRLADRRCKRVRVRAIRSDAGGTARVTIAVRRAAAHPAPAR